jgi:hypothetical protein
MPLSRSTLCYWMPACARQLEPLLKAMQKHIPQLRVIATADTPVPVQDPDDSGNCTGRLWIHLGEGEYPFLVYDYTANRSRDGSERFLKDYRAGYLQSDAYSVCDGLHAGADRRRLPGACAVVVSRGADEQPAAPHAALARVGRLDEVERAAKEEAAQRLAAEGPTRSEHERYKVIETVLHTQRQERSRPLWESFSSYLDTASRQVLPKSPLG